MRLLLVEDSTLAARTMTRQLERLGYPAPDHAVSAEQALDMLRSTTYAGVLLDWMLPGMSGLDLLRSMRGSRRYADTPVLMITGKQARHDVIEAIKAGASDYVTKPVPIGLLEKKVRALAAQATSNS
jgi:two-component system chemotaxis response regulator CheY